MILAAELPPLMLYVQAVGPTVVAIIAGFIAGYIALRQWRTAHDKLRLDMFDRRIAVYDATKALTNMASLHGQVTMEDLGRFYETIRGSEFLFFGETRKFVTNIGITAFKARMARASLQKSANHPREDRLLAEEQEMLDQLRAADEKLEKLFARYLDLSKVGLRRWSFINSHR
jgi:hypothetical protein